MFRYNKNGVIAKKIFSYDKNGVIAKKYLGMIKME